MSAVGGPEAISPRRPEAGEHQPGDNGHQNGHASFMELLVEAERTPPASRGEVTDMAVKLRGAAEAYAKDLAAPFQAHVDGLQSHIERLEKQLQALESKEQAAQGAERALALGNLTSAEREVLTHIAGDRLHPNTAATNRAALERAIEQAKDTLAAGQGTLERVEVRTQGVVNEAQELIQLWNDKFSRLHPVKKWKAEGRLENKQEVAALRQQMQELNEELGRLRQNQAPAGATPRFPEAPVRPVRPETTPRPEAPPRPEPSVRPEAALHPEPSVHPEAPSRPEPSIIENPTAALPQGEYGARQNGQYAATPDGIPARQLYAEANRLYTDLRGAPYDTAARERFAVLQNALEGVPGDTAFARIERLTDRLRNQDGLTPQQQENLNLRWDQLRDALRGTPEEAHERYTQLEAGVLAREIGALRPEDRGRRELVDNALEGIAGIPGEQINTLFGRLRPSEDAFATNDQQADAQERLALLRTALHASPEEIANLQRGMSADEMIGRIRGLGDDEPERRMTTEVLRDVTGNTDEEKVRRLDEDRRNNDPNGLRAQRRWMLVSGIQQGLQGLVQGLFSFTPPQS